MLKRSGWMVLTAILALPLFIVVGSCRRELRAICQAGDV